MREVAAHKWAHGLPIEDRAREARVLAGAEAAALRHGLKPAAVANLFELQIRAAKEIQGYWFGRWQGGETAPAAPDLNEQLRPRIIALGDAIVAAAARPRSDEPRLGAATGLNPVTARRLEDALAALEAYPDRLTQVLDSGVLRVGTTGDYAPFSLRRDGEEAYAGIDIELARDLAASLDAEVRFVPTSWPTLAEDHQRNAFDIAMSGVSRTLARQRIGFFSRAYYVGGKTAISRCADRERFRTLEAIDAPGVRIIVNPGGTNEAFVDARLARAEKVRHGDNRSIFAEIESGRADVMITDAIEVELMTPPGSLLCRATPDFLTYQEKGYLLPRDEAFRAYVDLWLSQRLGDGTVAEAFRRHGVRHALER